MNDDEKIALKSGNVVQISPKSHEGPFPGCFATVTHPQKWGCEGYVTVPRAQGQAPLKAPVKLQWREIELVGVKRFSM